jgi:hypothetical protein
VRQTVLLAVQTTLISFPVESVVTPYVISTPSELSNASVVAITVTPTDGCGAVLSCFPSIVSFVSSTLTIDLVCKSNTPITVPLQLLITFAV